MRDVLEPLLARFGREFPGYDPYPFGARRYVEQLVLSICFAEPLADEFAACFAGASDEELIALGMSFAFGNCIEQKDLCEIVTVVPRGTTPRIPRVRLCGPDRKSRDCIGSARPDLEARDWGRRAWLLSSGGRTPYPRCPPVRA